MTDFLFLSLLVYDQPKFVAIVNSWSKSMKLVIRVGHPR